MIGKSVSADEVQDAKDYLAEHTYDLAGGLNLLSLVQSVTSAINPNCIPAIGERADADQLRTYFLALIVETGELLQELNWKPWKAEKQVNIARVTDEFADMLAFLGIILVYLRRMGISGEVLAQAYRDKTFVNVERFLGKVEGYGQGKLDGTSHNPSE